MDVPLKGGIKALVLLNLQSYGGGRDLWGLQDVAKDKAKGWRVPIFNDGLIEVRTHRRGKIPRIPALSRVPHCACASAGGVLCGCDSSTEQACLHWRSLTNEDSTFCWWK